MTRFYYILLIVFWCASLTITVVQQSSLLADVLELWKTRLNTEQKIEKDLNEIFATISKRRLASSSSSNNENSNKPEIASTATSTIQGLLQTLRDIEEATKAAVSKLESDVDSEEKQFEDQQHQLAVQRDEADRKTNKQHKQVHQSANLPKLKEMRSECKNYGAQDALHRLVQEVRTKIYEQYPADLLTRYGERRGNSQIETIRLSSEFSNFNGEIEAVLDHLESMMPQILELWPRWFKEDGEPMPAPKFLSIEEGGEVHPSDKYGRKAYFEETL